MSISISIALFRRRQLPSSQTDRKVPGTSSLPGHGSRGVSCLRLVIRRRFLWHNLIAISTATEFRSWACISALVGVVITKLFALRADFEDLRWIAEAVSCAAASSVLGITNTVHPPAEPRHLLRLLIQPSATSVGISSRWSSLALFLCCSVHF
ncbi:uncharacterized protein N7469_001873 [Penicillium citrinum]|uniref:HPP transmembrane region domain-containing protein n=2 Tax=Penicillium TaxID=5073 RepID=A0A9W9PFJ0_PENCI|nr:uncharacterized protein N7469_001873 [Penicillium citrinum]KAJ5243546.1 hypothetical protein N7469_001873 [Penicillium citrinum]KAJ5598944.1 hypothetical protein N7450_000011 [Penicillium hetheringtonii]